MIRTREEILLAIAEIYVEENEGPDDGWDECNITNRIHELMLSEDGALIRCDVCSECYPPSWDGCPFSDEHHCEGGCGETIGNCCCPSCEGCGNANHECTCPKCARCDELVNDCECPEELRVIVKDTVPL
jgi:hypothetical protein